jgi:hypothetical protein
MLSRNCKNLTLAPFKTPKNWSEMVSSSTCPRLKPWQLPMFKIWSRVLPRSLSTGQLTEVLIGIMEIGPVTRIFHTIGMMICKFKLPARTNLPDLDKGWSVP